MSNDKDYVSFLSFGSSFLNSFCYWVLLTQHGHFILAPNIEPIHLLSHCQSMSKYSSPQAHMGIGAMYSTVTVQALAFPNPPKIMRQI